MPLSNRRTPSHDQQSGQILPLGLALLLVACASLFLFISLGRVLVARERHRMQVDLTAHAGAVDLARCLNIAAALNKTQMAIFAVSAYPPATLLAWANHVNSSRIIDAGMKVAGAIPEASVFYVGYQNGLKAIPVWSKGSEGDPSPLPTLNLQRRYLTTSLGDALAQVGQAFKGNEPPPSADPTSGLRHKYSYQPRIGGEEVSVDSSQVEKVIFRDRNGKLRQQSRQRDPANGKVKFVKESSTSDAFPIDLVELGPHRVTVIGFADNQDLYDSRLLPRPPAQTVIASAEAGGGDVKMSALMPNADFDAYLIPVQRGLHLNLDLGKVTNATLWLQRLGIALPDEVVGWTLIAH